MIKEMLDVVFNRNKIKIENELLNISREVKFIELIEEIGSVSQLTSVWKLAKARTYIGSEIEMTFKIRNIEGESIYIELVSKYEIDPIFYDSEEKDYHSVFLFYYGKRIEKQLLAYSKEDLVILKAKFQSVFYLSRLLLQFELISIEKNISNSENDRIGNKELPITTVLLKVEECF
jgi:hypothetical protein